MGLREHYKNAYRGFLRILHKLTHKRGNGSADSVNPQVETNGPSELREAPKKLHGPVPKVEWSWMVVAEQELGQSEVAGPKHNKRILEYHSTNKLKSMADEVPWCAAFVNWCLKQSGIEGTDSAAALSFLRWGIPCKFTKGAIVIFKRGNKSWQGHVGFAIDENFLAVKVLGGNQKNKVSYEWYLKKDLLGYRWPKHELSDNRLG